MTKAAAPSDPCRSRPLRVEEADRYYFVTTRTLGEHFWLHPVLTSNLSATCRHAQRALNAQRARLDRRIRRHVARVNKRIPKTARLLSVKEFKRSAAGLVTSALARAQAATGAGDAKDSTAGSPEAPIEEAPPIGGLGVDAPGLVESDPTKRVVLPLSVDERHLLTAGLYEASASAIEDFDPDDTLAARLEDSRSDEVERTSGPQQLVADSPKRIVVLRDRSELVKRRRREMRTARAAAKAANHSEGREHPHSSSQPSPEPDPPESPDIEEDDPNPPPH